MSKFQLNNLETIAVCTPNNSGRLIGKRIPIDRWAEIQNDGMLMPNFHLVTGIENKAQANMAVAGYATGFKNGILRPADKNLDHYHLKKDLLCLWRMYSIVTDRLCQKRHVPF